MTYTTSGELLEKAKSKLVPNYIYTFSGNEPNGGTSFGVKILNAKVQNLRKFARSKKQ